MSVLALKMRLPVQWPGVMAALAVALQASSGLAAERLEGPNPPVRVQMTEEGPVLATNAGMTLYSWSRDRIAGKPVCAHTRYSQMRQQPFGTAPLPAVSARKTCADKWPPLLAAADAKPGGDWSIAVRDDGSKQWSFQGRPLYISVKDKKPGDVNGMRLDPRRPDGWSVAIAPLDLPSGMTLVRRPEGLVLATAAGSLAYVRRGARTERVCSGCSNALRPLTAPDFGALRGDWSIVNSGGGLKQYAFKGESLYVLPDGLTEDDLDGLTGWAPALYRRTAGVPPQVHTRATLLGRIYTTDTGKTVYAFHCTQGGTPDQLTCDDPGDAAAYWSALCGDSAECSRRWRPYLATTTAKPVGDWTIEDVSDPLFLDAAGTTYPPETKRVKAWAYRGRPVYTFVDDEGPGDFLGHNTYSYGSSNIHALLVPGETTR